MKAIQVKNLTKYYGKFLAVKNLTFDVSAGEIVGFIGKNGAGKSTTIRTILNFLFPTSGEIMVMGLDSAKDTLAIKEISSYVPSEVSFPPNLRVRDVLELSRKFCNATKDEVAELTKFFELDTTKKIVELSLGNRKKLSITQALLKKPKVIILDEPTSGLDPVMQERLFEKLKLLSRNGSAVLLSSHNLQEVQSYCDRVVIIKDGELKEISNLEKVLEEGGFNFFYQTKDGKKIVETFLNINDGILSMNQLDLVDLRIEQTNIQDRFLAYYEGQHETKH